MMFRYATCRDLGDYRELDTKMDPGAVREQADIIVLPMANNINPSFNMGYLATFIERCNLPVLAVGLGAQAKLGGGLSEPLPAGSKRFLDVLSERSVAIGVRGPFTAQVLADHGVDNVVVTGCPSNFINPDEQLGKRLSEGFVRARENTPRRVAVYSQLGRKNFDSPNIESERHLFSLVRKHGYHYVHTFPSELIDFVRGGDEVTARWIASLESRLMPNTSEPEFAAKFREQSHAFLQVESWMEFSRSCDMSIGKRVHGCLNTIQAGTPGVLVYHDERTRELAETLALPRVNVEDIHVDDDLAVMLEKTSFSDVDYDLRRRELHGRYDKLFTESGLSNVNPLFRRREKRREPTSFLEAAA